MQRHGGQGEGVLQVHEDHQGDDRKESDQDRKAGVRGLQGGDDADSERRREDV